MTAPISGTALDRLEAATWRRLEPPPIESVSAWVGANRVLSAESSATPGPMSLDTTPPLIEPTNALTDPATHTVVLVKPSQLGGTEMCINCLLWTLVNDPGPAMVIQPTLEMAGAFSKDRLTPAIRDCELVRNLVGTPRSAMPTTPSSGRACPGRW